MAASGDCQDRSCSYLYLAYTPALSANAALCAIFSTLVLLALVLGLRYPSAVFTLLLLSGLALEVLGYVGRILLSTTKYSHNNFSLFFLGTIVGPSLICGALFLCLPNIIYIYGPNFRTWTPPWYHGIFLGAVAVSVVLEIVGGILATVVADDSKIALGIQLVAVGLAVIIVAVAVFAAHATLLALALRTRKHGLGFEHAHLYNSGKFKRFLIALCTATLLLVVRSTFRLITLVTDLTGQDSGNEILLLSVDGIMVVVASTLILLVFPPRILKQTWFTFRPPKTNSAATAMSQPSPGHPHSPYYIHNARQTLYNSRLPGPPPRPPPPRPPPPPPLSVQRSPAAYDQYRDLEYSPNAGAVNHSRQPSLASGAPSPPFVLREPPRKNMVTSESLW